MFKICSQEEQPDLLHLPMSSVNTLPSQFQAAVQETEVGKHVRNGFSELVEASSSTL